MANPVIEGLLVLSSTDLSNSTVTSDPIPAYMVSKLSIQIVFTGSPTGTFKLQGSTDRGYGTPSNWTDLSNMSSAVTAAGDIMWTVEGVKWVRMVYTKTSGTGTITSYTYYGNRVI